MKLPLLLSLVAASLGSVALVPLAHAADSDGAAFLTFARAQGAALRANDPAPTNAAEWSERRERLRANLAKAWGDFPAEPAPLEARKLGEFARDGYKVERVTFQTLPGVWMLANAYVPDRPGKLPAVLCVHGHWAKAKQDPVVQSRCIGLAKLGFFVLAVDAFGAGERAIGKALGEYHGAMTGALLLPLGQPLSGIQRYENGRAIDYLLTRPEVDGSKIGVTGASGGGNQSMYAGAFDERFAAVTPVCSVGTYQAYLGAACCMCEVVPGALRFTEEGDLLGLAAPRGLMVINATRDAHQFSVGEAKKSIGRATQIFQLLDRPQQVRHTIIDSAHDYNQAMREAMYGWMTKILKGTGDGSPIPEPAIKTEDPETLRCYPGDSRPDDYITLPRYASRRADELRRARESRKDAADRQAQRKALAQLLTLDQAAGGSLELRVEAEEGVRQIHFQSEPGIRLVAELRPGPAKPPKVAIVLAWEGSAAALASDAAKGLREQGYSLVTLDLRATGRWAVPGDKIGDAPDHNSAEWALWIGRPMLGQWVHDVRRAIDALREANFGELPKEVHVVGVGPASVIALAAAALDERITATTTVGGLLSFRSDVPYKGQLIGNLVPGFLRDFGDIADLARLAASADRPVRIERPVHGSGAPCSEQEVHLELGGTKAK